jgi:hypothetical protein
MLLPAERSTTKPSRMNQTGGLSSDSSLAMDQKIRKIVLVVFLVALSCCLVCAKEGMPPGGPEDATPPEIVSVWPPNGATEVALDSKLEIVFNEGMTKEITEQSVFISPLPKEPFDFEWKGKKLMLSPPQPLYPERTYVVSIGADAQDLRRNRLGQTYTFAFSTGDRLDFGTISGQVWIKKQIGFKRQIGASVWAYLLDQSGRQVDPATDRPDYITQTDQQGGYLLKNLSLGTYRLFAVQDESRDLSWNWKEETIGMTTLDPELTDLNVSASAVNFILCQKDQQGPSLSICHAVNRHMARLEFDEELAPPSALDLSNYLLTSAVSHESVKISSVFFEDDYTGKITLLTEDMKEGEEYEITVTNVVDRAGNAVDTSARDCRFKGSGLPDTLVPHIAIIDPADGEANVPLDAGVTIIFSQPPDPLGIEASFSLLDPANVKIAGKGSWIGTNVYLFKPDSLLTGNTRFQANLPGKQIRNLAGNVSGPDSMFTSNFTTVDGEILGSVSGQVEIGEGMAISPPVLILWELEKEGVSYRISLEGPGRFSFTGILPGKYFLAAYLDLNEDGLLSLGKPKLFSPMEPFEVYPDTIFVRSRWETEAVELAFRPH